MPTYNGRYAKWKCILVENLFYEHHETRYSIVTPILGEQVEVIDNYKRYMHDVEEDL